MKKKYRIMKKYWRDEESAEIKHKFHIEKKTFFGWQAHTYQACFLYDIVNYAHVFKTEEEAITFLNNLQKEIPGSEEIYLFSYQIK